MKTGIISITVSALLLLAGIFTFAQNNSDSTIREREKQLIELSKTNQNHKLLSELTGNWNFAGAHFSADSGKIVVEFKGSITRKSIMDGRYFICETTGGKLVMPWSDGKEVTYQDMYIEGYDNDRKKFFRASVANHWTTGIITMEGDYDSATKTFTYEVVMERGGEKRTFYDHIRIIDADHYSFARYRKMEDRKVKVSESSFTRSVK